MSARLMFEITKRYGLKPTPINLNACNCQLSKEAGGRRQKEEEKQ
jgi:hypothetical protein